MEIGTNLALTIIGLGVFSLFGWIIYLVVTEKDILD